jgi:competence protein ComEC
MLGSALSLLIGILLVQQLPLLPDIQWLVLGGVVAGIMAWLRYWRGLFFVLGVLWAIVFAMTRLSDALSADMEGVVPVTGMIASLPEYDERRVSFDFIVSDSPKPLPNKIRLSWYSPQQAIKAGQHWSFTVKLKRPHGFFNTSSFDYEKQLFIEGIGATGYIRPKIQSVLLGQKSAWLSISVWRQSITDKLSELLPNSPSLGLIKALTIGDGGAISQNQWEVFRKTGTTHLVVISGSHIGLIAGLVYFLVLRLWAWMGILRWSPQHLAAIVALVVGVFYSALAGFSVPTQRAAIMLAVAMFAIISQRNPQPFHTLATALIAVLLFDPLAVLAAGFWLSFIAVALIIYTVAGRLGKLNIMLETLKLNGVMSLGLVPLTLLFFQQVSLISPIANAVAVPLISFLIVPFALLAVVLMFIAPDLASGLFWLVDELLQGLWWLLNQLAALPYAIISHTQPSIIALLFAVVAIVILLAPKGIPARWLGLVLLLPLIFTEKQSPATGDLKLTLLDVGQGLAAVIQTANHTLVYDTGAKFSADSDQGKNILLPFLHQQGVNKVDQLVISHGDNDHIGGAESLIKGIAVEKISTSVPDQLSDYQPEQCAAGQAWTWDGIQFTMLSPSEQLSSENNNSCVLQVQTASGNVLLTGDIEAQAETWLVKTYGEQLKAQILIAPHHGSKTSSTLSFLQAVQADTILIPAGYRNPFGHPHNQVIARYQTLNAHYLSSANSGEISVNLKNGVWSVQGLRQTDRHYWNFLNYNGASPIHPKFIEDL